MVFGKVLCSLLWVQPVRYSVRKIPAVAGKLDGRDSMKMKTVCVDYMDSWSHQLCCTGCVLSLVEEHTQTDLRALQSHLRDEHRDSPCCESLLQQHGETPTCDRIAE